MYLLIYCHKAQQTLIIPTNVIKNKKLQYHECFQVYSSTYIPNHYKSWYIILCHFAHLSYIMAAIKLYTWYILEDIESLKYGMWHCTEMLQFIPLLSVTKNDHGMLVTCSGYEVCIFWDLMSCSLIFSSDLEKPSLHLQRRQTTIQKEAASSSEILINVYQTTWNHIPGDSNFSVMLKQKVNLNQ
jgi:hypothetical protein